MSERYFQLNGRSLIRATILKIVEKSLQLLQSLVYAKGPCGAEDEVRAICQKELLSITQEIWTDPAGNLIGKISGKDPLYPPIRIMVHMDEISLIVKRINEDGSLRVNPTGGLLPAFFGQGVVDILADHKPFSGIFSFGSIHTTKETVEVNKMLPEEYRGQGKGPIFEDIRVITRQSPAALTKAGVHPGTRVVIGHTRRTLHLFQDCVASYFLDNRGAIAIALIALKNLKKHKPRGDVYFVATSAEEVGAHGASYAARTLPGALTLAIDVGPVAKEYQTTLSPSPIIVYQDGVALYHKPTADHLMKWGHTLKLNPQAAVFSTYGSDASLAYSRGQSAQAALICFPVENTHGYEVTHQKSLNHCARLLEAYLIDPV